MSNETNSTPLTLAEGREERFARVLDNIYSAAQSSAVYSEPVTTGNYTIITASEIAAGGGFGSGSMMLPPMQQEETFQPQAQSSTSSGSGMGGGGGSSGRPVAIIIIGPDGVSVKPVMDLTKIALAGVTVLGTMVIGLWRMGKTKKH